MVYKLLTLVGLGENVPGTDIEMKKWVESLTSNKEITREKAEAKIKQLKKQYPNIIKAFIIQASKMKLENGKNRKILATREDGTWT